jgi:G:T-mismatch repair DNA endonuclease (very short patch repair protein)
MLGCRYFVIPKADIKYWEFKSNHNSILDENNSKYLNQIRIKYEILRECQIKEQLEKEVKRVIMRTTI